MSSGNYLPSELLVLLLLLLLFRWKKRLAERPVGLLALLSYPTDRLVVVVGEDGCESVCCCSAACCDAEASCSAGSSLFLRIVRSGFGPSTADTGGLWTDGATAATALAELSNEAECVRIAGMMAAVNAVVWPPLVGVPVELLDLVLSSRASLVRWLPVAPSVVTRSWLSWWPFPLAVPFEAAGWALGGERLCERSIPGWLVAPTKASGA